MRKGHEVRAFDYVNHPYERVRDALRHDPDEIFRQATKAAASRARDVVTGLHVNLAGIEVGAEIAIEVTGVDAEETTPHPVIRLHLEWEAARAARLFPFMRGEFSAYPLTATETQLDFAGRYEPPLGPLGDAIDAAIGHKIAEASVHRFVGDVAKYLRSTISAS